MSFQGVFIRRINTSVFQRLQSHVLQPKTKPSSVYFRVNHFHTSPRRPIPPVIWILVKPIAQLTAALTGRGVRKWWRALPKEHKQSIWTRMKQNWPVFAAMGGGVGAYGWYYYKSHITPAPVTGRERFIVVSREQLLKIAEAEAQVNLDKYQNSLVPVEAPLFQKVLNIAARLVAANPELLEICELDNWKLSIVKGDDINAFVVPNGHVFVFTGLLEFAENEDQVAMVLGHEMAHTLLSHGAEKLSFAQLLDVVVITVMAAIWTIMPTDGIAVVTQWFYNRVIHLVLHMPYSRKLEKEADSVGMRIAAKACYDIREASVLWQRMQMLQDLKAEDVNLEWLSTHPSNIKRSKHLEFLIPECEKVRNACSCPPLPKLDPRQRTKPLQDAVTDHKTAKKSGQNLRQVTKISQTPKSILS